MTSSSPELIRKNRAFATRWKALPAASSRKLFRDLDYIRSASEGGSTRAEGLQSMKLAAKELRVAAKADKKAATRGAIKAEGATGHVARIQYLENSIGKEICGPSRRSERRAKIDLDTLRAAAQGKTIQEDGYADMRAANLELHKAADMENRVAFGAEQYELQRMAHKTEDSDPESGGDDDDGYEDPYADIDVKAFVKQLEEQQDKNIVQKPPPTDANDATVQLACFQPIKEAPEALRAILAARADPNIVVGDSLSPLRRVIAFARPRDAAAMRDLLLQHGAAESQFEKQRWHERQAAEGSEAAWLQNFHRSAPTHTQHMRSLIYTVRW